MKEKYSGLICSVDPDGKFIRISKDIFRDSNGFFQSINSKIGKERINLRKTKTAP